MIWNEKKIMEAYHNKVYGDGAIVEKSEDFVKELVNEIEKISNSDEYDNTIYITEVLRDEYAGQLLTINGRTYAAVNRGSPVGKIVGVLVTDELGKKHFGIGVSKIDPKEPIRINLIGNHIAFLRAKENALKDLNLRSLLNSDNMPPLSFEQILQVEHFFLRCYKYFKLSSEYEKDYKNVKNLKDLRRSKLRDCLGF